MAIWVDGMNRFARWADSVDGGALAAKPLWLTEFGVLRGFCPRALPIRDADHPAGGVPCPGAARRGNERSTDDFVFYGRHDREGIWGAQHATLSYLLNPAAAPHANRGDWTAAWWFAGRMDWHDRGECRMTGWLLGRDADCSRDLDQISRAGQTLRATIDRLAHP
jgi:hypothetical protein